MDCGKCKMGIDDFFYGEINEMDKDVSLHIEACNSCKSYYDESNAAMGFIDSLKNQNHSYKIRKRSLILYFMLLKEGLRDLSLSLRP